jgi:hypothetical protein
MYGLSTLWFDIWQVHALADLRKSCVLARPVQVGIENAYAKLQYVYISLVKLKPKLRNRWSLIGRGITIPPSVLSPRSIFPTPASLRVSENVTISNFLRLWNCVTWVGECLYHENCITWMQCTCYYCTLFKTCLFRLSVMFWNVLPSAYMKVSAVGGSER